MAGLPEIDAWPQQRAREEFSRCCGSSRWAERMAASRPYREESRLFEAADRVWDALGFSDWLEAFGRHPRIGGKDALRAKFAATRSWSQGEQERVQEASEAVLDGLTEGNRRYEERFGFIFIVCATGKKAEGMLALLRERLGNDKETELRLAAAEQKKITRIRLEKLLRT